MEKPSKNKSDIAINQAGTSPDTNSLLDSESDKEPVLEHSVTPVRAGGRYHHVKANEGQLSSGASISVLSISKLITIHAVTVCINPMSMILTNLPLFVTQGGSGSDNDTYAVPFVPWY